MKFVAGVLFGAVLVLGVSSAWSLDSPGNCENQLARLEDQIDNYQDYCVARYNPTDVDERYVEVDCNFPGLEEKGEQGGDPSFDLLEGIE